MFSEEQLIDSGLLLKNGIKTNLCGALYHSRIIIPYLEENTVIGIKTRVNPLDLTENDYQKYLIPNGTPIRKMLWHPPVLHSDVILTEGELKAIAGCEAGIPTCALPGMGCTTETLKNFRRLVDKFRCQRIFIIIDSDPYLESKISNIRQAIRIHCLFQNSVILFLPQDRPDLKMDLDTYLTKYSPQHLQELMEGTWAVRDTITRKWRERLVWLQSQIQ